MFLPVTEMPAEHLLSRAFPWSRPRSCSVVDRLAERVQRFLSAEAVTFSLETVALEVCPGLQRRVLLLERQVPRGWVSTYGRLARQLGVPGGARAVGSALARNPFPIIIPCHRTIRSDGRLGGFQGGAGMKRALLELEGNLFGPQGRILAPRFLY